MEKGEVREKGWSAAVLCGLDRRADTLSGTLRQVRGKRHSSRLGWLNQRWNGLRTGCAHGLFDRIQGVFNQRE
jgi:hypothetical protein